MSNTDPENAVCEPHPAFTEDQQLLFGNLVLDPWKLPEGSAERLAEGLAQAEAHIRHVQGDVTAQAAFADGVRANVIVESANTVHITVSGNGYRLELNPNSLGYKDNAVAVLSEGGSGGGVKLADSLAGKIEFLDVMTRRSQTTGLDVVAGLLQKVTKAPGDAVPEPGKPKEDQPADVGQYGECELPDGERYEGQSGEEYGESTSFDELPDHGPMSYGDPEETQAADGG